MNITELEKIIAQIKKYQLEDEIRDIENWLGKLNEKQIGNFLSLEIYLLKPIEKIKSLLVSAKALNGDYYLEDIKLINEAKTDEIANWLSNVAMNANSLESEYHREDMKLIADAKNDVIANCLSRVSMDADSLESEHHIEDMKRLANAKNDKDANEIYDNIIKQYEVKNKKEESNYVTFQEKIDAIHQNAVEYTDGDTTKELDDSVFTLKQIGRK